MIKNLFYLFPLTIGESLYLSEVLAISAESIPSILSHKFAISFENEIVVAKNELKYT